GGLFLFVGRSRLGDWGRVEPKGASILVVASLAWACGSVYSKHGSLPRSPLLGVTMQGLAGGAVLWIAGLLTGELRQFHISAISSRSWLAMAYLVAFGSVLGFTAYLYILKRSTPARVGTYAWVTRVVAFFLGWLFAGESIPMRPLLAAGVIFTAVILVITAPACVSQIAPAAGEAD